MTKITMTMTMSTLKMHRVRRRKRRKKVLYRGVKRGVKKIRNKD